MKRVRRLSAADISRELKLLEKRHGMKTSEFLKSYRSGKLGHGTDFVRWMGLCRMSAAAPEAKKRVRSS